MAPLEQPQPQPARPSMISAKYRQKEERRKLLKLSVAKLRRIEDPESALRRSVLINNTVRRLQREAKQAPLPLPLPLPLPPPPQHDLDELEDVLSQFYMPPTPRMITSIDEDDEPETDTLPSSASSSPSCAPSRRPSSGPRPPSKRIRFDRLPQDRLDDEEARALADPTNTLEDFKDDVCMRSKPLPRTPLSLSRSSANAPFGEDVPRAELCGRRYTGHDRENIAPTGAAEGPASGSVPVLGAVPLPLPGPYTCGQAHGQASALVFHGFMATMES